MTKRKPRKPIKRKRTDTGIIDALEALPGRVSISYNSRVPRDGNALLLRDQINRFLDDQPD